MTKEEIRAYNELVIHHLIALDEDVPDFEKEVAENADIVYTGRNAVDFGMKTWEWPQGVGLYGLCKLQEKEASSRFLPYIRSWFEDNLKEVLPSKNINTTAPYLAMLELALLDHNEHYLELCRERAEWLMKELPRTTDGGFQHVVTDVKDRQKVIAHEQQLWADTLFMAVLFLGKMGLVCNRQDWIDESAHQFLVHIRYLQNIKTGLLYHGWTFIGKNNFGNVYWCRGNSWFTYGAVAYLEMMGDAIPACTRTFILDSWKAQAEALLSLQAESGLWHTILDDPETYEETSGSAAITAGLLIGIKKGYLDASVTDQVMKSVNGICSMIAADGTVEGVSAGTAIGDNAEHYKNIILGPMAYGQALTMLALAEAL